MRGIIRELQGITDQDVTITDLEAGLEHLKRGTPRHADAMLVVMEPYWRAMETAARIAQLAKGLEIPIVGVVGNKARDDRDRNAIQAVADTAEVPVLGVIPFDEHVTEADRQGSSLLDHAPDSPAVQAVRAVREELERLLSGRLAQPN